MFLFPISGSQLPLIIFGIFMSALLVVLLVATPLVFVLYQAYNKIKYVFFPSCQPPLSIEVSSDFSQLSLHRFFLKIIEKKCFTSSGSAKVHFRDFFVQSPVWHRWGSARILFWNEKGQKRNEKVSGVSGNLKTPGICFNSCVASSGSKG